MSLLLPTLALADELQRQQQEQQEERLKTVRSKIKDLLSVIRAEKDKKNNIEQKLREVEIKLGKVRRTIKKLNRDISNNKKKLKTLKKKHSQLQRKLQEQRQLLAKQIYSAYVSGNREQIKLILNQEDPAELSRLSTYFDYINEARTEQIKATQETMTKIIEVGQAIEEKNKHLLSLNQQHEVQRKALSSNKNTRQKVLDKIRTHLRQEDHKLSKLRRSEKDIQTLLSSLAELLADIPETPATQVAFSTLKGKLKWPTQGKAGNTFGAPRNVGDLKWHGLMLRAPAGRPVKAVASGRVAFADWLQGFGLLVIIDHDNGYLSLYGHNQVLFKEVGDWVAQNENIAQVGDSGGLEQSALYFELRHNGKPINPRKWCVKLNS